MATNRALNKTATCKDILSGGYEAGLSVDGNASTRWLSGTGNNTWWKVDLAAEYAINGFKITWSETYCPRVYSFQYSDNDTDWVTWFQVLRTVSSSRIDELKMIASESHRYWRIYVDYASGNVQGAWEIELYDDSTYEPPEIASTTDLAYGKTAIASAILAAGYEAYLTVDGDDANTRWASGSSPVWIYFDLNDPQYSNNEYKIDKARIKWENYKTLSIQYSDNATDWTDAVTNHTGSANDETIEWAQATAHRYWRLSMGTAYSSIFTVNLFTSDPPKHKASKKRRFVCAS